MEKKLLRVLNTVLENNGLSKIQSLSRELKLRDQLELDSINLAELTVRIEDEFDVDIFEDGIVETVGEIMTILERSE